MAEELLRPPLTLRSDSTAVQMVTPVGLVMALKPLGQCLKFYIVYVAKSNSELQQRAIPKQAPILTIVDEREESVERQVQRIPTISPEATDAVPQSEDVGAKAQPEVSTLNAAAEDVSAQGASVSSTVGTSDEPPHIHVESVEAREARMDRQWKEVKVRVADLPDIYARLAKIKLTALVVTTAAAGYAMAPVPFDPIMFFVSCLGTGLASCTANSINQP
ncbi:hypothetical protein INR49_027256 [Caranx melampygus]|nr:hypothetical protein INR49_027256 [Caranx melampygus]